MKDIRSQEQIDEMRKRLYDRGAVTSKTTRHQLTDVKMDVNREWQKPESANSQTSDLRAGLSTDRPSDLSDEPQADTEKKPRRRYRSFVLIGSLLIFIIVAGLSSVFLYFGGNQVSNENIQVIIDGENSVGGGETYSFEVAVGNQNTVPIESATLILQYPEGTQSTGDIQRNLFEERIPLDDIQPGDAISVPVQVAIFGEENAERTINAIVEYRIGGSNNFILKEAEPLTTIITSSPLVLRVNTIEKVASGQFVDVELTAVSNASTPLNDILITAEYPNGFDYEISEPSPFFGEGVWKIDELLPEEEYTIKITGVVRGLTEETFRVNFAAGPADPDEPVQIGAALTDARADFTIERPFIDVSFVINGEEDRDVIIPEGQRSTVQVDIVNTLDETVYDMMVEVSPSGNALDESSIVGQTGFYDSNTETVRWEVSNNPSFEEVNPGDRRTLEFEIFQGDVRTTSAFEIDVNVYARRVAETSALEQLIGTVQAVGKYSSSVMLGSQAGRNVGRFGDSGPIPPKVGQTTTYTITIVAEAGANDMSNAVVETSLPIHATWLDSYDAPGTVTYNDVSKQLQWAVGDIPSGERKEFTYQVSILPSTSQVRRSPVLTGRQTIRANDRFTGALLRDEAEAVTTELSTELGFEAENGVVER